MATDTAAQRERHWRDRAITAAEVISDAFDVAKAYGAHLANWILWFCLLANLIEMVSAAFEAFAGLTIVGIQSISLDIAGFGLTAMAASAKRRGDEQSAKKANAMGWTLILVMAVTVGLITLSALHSEWASIINQINQGLMFVRVIVTVFYGHVVHSLRTEGAAHENRLQTLEAEVSALQNQLVGRQQEVAEAEQRLTNAQKAYSALQVQRSNEQEAAHVEIESLRGKLEIKADEVKMMQADQAGVIDLRREIRDAHIRADDLAAQLAGKEQALKNEQLLVTNLRREVERLQQNETRQFVPSQNGTMTGSRLVPLPQRSMKRPYVERETAPAGQGETDEAGDCKSAVYARLNQDNTLQVADLTRLTGFPKTTVWRHWNRYHEDHGTRGAGATGESDGTQQAESETA